jgi:hypothetical protein
MKKWLLHDSNLVIVSTISKIFYACSVSVLRPLCPGLHDHRTSTQSSSTFEVTRNFILQRYRRSRRPATSPAGCCGLGSSHSYSLCVCVCVCVCVSERASLCGATLNLMLLYMFGKIMWYMKENLSCNSHFPILFKFLRTLQDEAVVVP